MDQRQQHRKFHDEFSLAERPSDCERSVSRPICLAQQISPPQSVRLRSTAPGSVGPQLDLTDTSAATNNLIIVFPASADCARHKPQGNPMLNKPWIDPRVVDWTDPLNGVRNPGFRENNNPFVFRALNDQFMQALRQSKGIEPRIYVCPDPANQTIKPGATYDFEVPSEPNLWLWGIVAEHPESDATSAGNDTFLLSVTDSSTGATLYSQPVSNKVVTGIPAVGTTPTPAGSGNGYRGPIVFLSTPHLFAPPSYPVVRIVNTTLTASLICRVTLYTAVEYDL